MTRLRASRTAVFDLDGTLVDSLPLVLAAITHAVEPFAPKPTMDIFAHLGGPPSRFMADLLPDPQHLPVALQRMEAYHSRMTHLIRPFAGAVEMLETLRESGATLAVWTGRDRRSTERILRDLDFAGYFPVVVCGDDLDTHKPDPAGLRHILTRLGANAADTLYVGDADVDVLGGSACGVDTLLIRHQRSIAEAVAALAWQTVPSPSLAYAAVRARFGLEPC